MISGNSHETLIRSVTPKTGHSATKPGRCGRCDRSTGSRIHTQRVLWRALVCAATLSLAACAGGPHLSFLNPQGPIADAQRWHFYEVLGVMVVLVAGPIFLLLPFFAWRYRLGNNKARYTPQWKYSRLLEILSWGGPVVIVAILAFFVWRDTHRLDPYRPLSSTKAPLRIQVIGYDWKWLFIYPDQNIATIGTLALPVDRPVSFRITSATVMQSFFIPALGSQIYAMGGMVSQLNLEAHKPGASLGENTMYNGDGFHQQKFTVQAMDANHFSAWTKQVRASGMPLDAKTLQLIAKRSTRAELIAAMPRVNTIEGTAFFTGASPTIFPAVVKATMQGDSSIPASAFTPSGKPAAGKDDQP
ncbi:cytochrome ubiquinol oxidase subunit II [Rhodanobacter sp. AS-Z3]|uniref:cytochrome ubiquinol oxidase subunit II n=1 Tax=Rhodanobacter sp. AS-Z3 TaxID=3031330 RepID=UPI0024792FC8|nr:cytochrome ubiquinol oxidase subunit II [Rhodanobacter sp. AS-Z3]WEN13945.1 cytochrome ubiquinol oxidase subunit II [Rhodanobacter sp. AS-Z3]